MSTGSRKLKRKIDEISSNKSEVDRNTFKGPKLAPAKGKKTNILAK